MLVLLAGVPLAGVAATFAAELIPDRLVVDRLAGAVDSGHLTTQNYGSAISGHQVDRFTDCIGMSVGLSDRAGDSPLTSAIRSPMLGDCSKLVPAIESYRSGNGLISNGEYFRYWHGYSAALRPSLALTGVRGSRLLALVFLCGTVLGLGRSLARRFSWRVPVVMFAPWLLTADFFEMPTSLPHAYGSLSMLLTGWAALVIASRTSRPSTLMAGAWAGGSFVVFFDILTVPPLGWAMYVVLTGFGLMSGGTLSDKALLSRTVGVGAAWILGWTWMWVSKWAFAAMSFGADVVRTTITRSVGERIDGNTARIDDRFFASTKIVVLEWWHQPLTGVTCAVLLVVVGLALRSRSTESWTLTRRAILALPLAIPFVWFELLRNHSQIHHWFVYRSVPFVLGAFAAVLVAGRLASDRDDADQGDGDDQGAVARRGMDSTPSTKLSKIS